MTGNILKVLGYISNADASSVCFSVRVQLHQRRQSFYWW